MDILCKVRRALERSGADVFEIGRSECGLPLMCAHKGSYGGPQLVITAGIHARECYTALAVVRQTGLYRGRRGVYFLPLINPDGALFFERGETFGRKLLACNADKRALWKANADGVDLNTNFDARWGSGKHNVRVPGPSDCIGSFPLCAAETRALARFTLGVLPAMTVSYHCMGGELYWEFFQTARRERDLRIASAVARHIGVERVDGHLCSAGGYKDWCIEALGIPALTIELVREGNHPLGADAFVGDIRANADLPEFVHCLLEKENRYE